MKKAKEKVNDNGKIYLQWEWNGDKNFFVATDNFIVVTKHYKYRTKTKKELRGSVAKLWYNR